MSKLVDDQAYARRRMVEEQIMRRGVKDRRVLDAMMKVPRHFFVEDALRSQAYADHPLQIGERQTISQPFIVAAMTEALKPQPGDRVLEIGTGSGYQAAVLARLARRVYSVERLRGLMNKARSILDELNVHNVYLKLGDGTLGWPQQAPFDCIIVTAGAPGIPQPLVDQLAPGGRLVVPEGDRESQMLRRVTRTEEGLVSENITGCRFVPLIGEQGWGA